MNVDVEYICILLARGTSLEQSEHANQLLIQCYIYIYIYIIYEISIQITISNIILYHVLIDVNLALITFNIIVIDSVD